MKIVVFKDEVTMLSGPFKEELESGEYYEMPDELVNRYRDALYQLEELELEIVQWTSNHPMASEQQDLEVAPTIPILPPGVDK